jgi:hypothetical protein
VSKKQILTDCDGVLLDWERMFHLWMEAKGYTRNESNMYDINHAYGIEKDHGHNLIREFNASAWIRYLPAFRDARSGVARLHELGYTFCCITSLSLDCYARELRIENLADVFGRGVFTDVVCLDTGADKDRALSPYKDTGLFWIEDKAQNAVLGAELGLRSILIDHAHNTDCDHEQVMRAADWADVVRIISSN